MIIVMKADVAEASPELGRIIALAHSFPGVTTQVHRVVGQTRALTEIYLLGPTGVVPTQAFEEFESVEKVVRVTQKFRAIGRHDALEAASFEYRGVRIAQDTLHVFPGLCAVDTLEHQDLVFAALGKAGITTARAGAYKPRTS